MSRPAIRLSVYYWRGHGWSWHYPRPEAVWRPIGMTISRTTPDEYADRIVCITLLRPCYGGWEPDPDRTLDGADIVWMLGNNLQWEVL